MSVLSAAQSGDELETLKAMRDALAAAMDADNPSVVAQVSGRLESVLKRIGELDKGGRVTIEDALAERRANRERPADVAAGSRRSGKSAG